MKKLTKKQQHAIDALAYMQELFAEYPLTELVYTSPFQLLVAVIMSAQTTDKQVNKVNEQFFRVVERPEDIVALGESGVGDSIKTVGLRKSKTTNLVKMAAMIMKNAQSQNFGEKGKMKNGTTNSTKSNQQKDIRAQQWQYTDAQALYDDRGYRIPDTIEEITKLPGVGIKTAKVVLYILYGQRRVAVDTHVHRVMNRLGIVTTNTPEQTSVLLETIIPDERKDVAHRVIIYFGRYWCTAKKPNCVACKLKDVCPRYQQHKKKL